MDSSAKKKVVQEDLQAGAAVGEYVVDCKIGEGGFGAVYRATHPLIGKLAAIKVLARRYSTDPEIVSRFVAEARAVNQIRHRNIIDIFGFGELDDGRSYYVMELLDGEPLDARLAHSGGLSIDEALPILRAIARALDAAHAKGIAHRDLKPENVFLTSDADGSVYPKLLDFGIAKLLGETASGSMHRTRTGAPIGTPYYMSPEQCRGLAVDHRTDIYAFGCVAYEVLTGKLPFEADNHLDILMRHLSEEPARPSLVAPHLPAAVDDAIASMMRKDPAHRPPSLAAAIEALEHAVGIAPVTRASTPRMQSANRTPAHGVTALAATMAATPAPVARRRVPVAWLVAAGVVAAIAVMLFATRTHEVPPQPAAPVVQQQPPPPAAAAPSPPPPPEPAYVTIHVTATPAGTDVFGPQGRLGLAPGDIQLPRGGEPVQLTFSADGYIAQTAKVTPDHEDTLAIALAAKPRPRAQVRKVQAPKPQPAAPVIDPYARE